MTTPPRKLSCAAALAAALSLVSLPACDIDVGDLNNPGIDDLVDNPTRVTVTAGCVGLLIGNRRNRAAANGYVSQLGILARESYNFDAADPRFIGELLEGNLQAGSPFGGNFWAAPYANIRLANIVQTAVVRVADFTEEERSAILGYSKTIEATDLLEVVNTRDTNGGVIDTDRPPEESLGAIVSKDAMLTEIARLLDEAAGDLSKGGMRFPFRLSTGFTGLSTPAAFTRYNRAIRARVAVYQKSYATALTALGASFLDDTMLTVDKLDVGAYHVYSIGSGDATNGLINPNIFAHPSFRTDAATNGATRDARFTRKTVTATSGGARGLSSDLKYTLYTSPSSRVPIIRNEELILLRAEAKYFSGDQAGALADLNLVRTVSGGLPALTAPADAAAFTTALLYERRYSLAFEGHRWIDVRRFDRLATLPLDNPTVMGRVIEHGRNVRFPLPRAECNARPDEPACMLGSK